MADKYKPYIIKALEDQNHISIVANHYGKINTNFQNLKLPNIIFCKLKGSEIVQCITSLKQDSSYLKYCHWDNNNKISLIYIIPQIETNFYVSLIYFNMFAIIHTNKNLVIHELEKLADLHS